MEWIEVKKILQDPCYHPSTWGLSFSQSEASIWLHDYCTYIVGFIDTRHEISMVPWYRQHKAIWEQFRREALRDS